MLRTECKNVEAARAKTAIIYCWCRNSVRWRPGGLLRRRIVYAFAELDEGIHPPVQRRVNLGASLLYIATASSSIRQGDKEQ